MSASISGGSTIEPPKQTKMAGSSLKEDDLCLYFGQVRVTYKGDAKETKTSPGSSSNVSPIKSQQSEAYCYPKRESGLEYSKPVPTPLYPQDIWRGQFDNSEAQNLGSNNLNGQNFTGSGSSRSSGLYRAGLNAYDGCQSIGMYANNQRYQNSAASSNRRNQSSPFIDESMLRSCKIAGMAMTQSGSQFLLETLAKTPSLTNVIFEGIYNFLYEVMSDSHGHHLFGKIIQVCCDYQLQLIVAQMTMSMNMAQLSASKYGSKSMQRLIKVLENSPLVVYVVEALSRVFEELMTNRTACFVILKCLSLLDTKKNKKLYEAALKLCIPLAQNDKGCISLNQFITNSKAPYRELLMSEITTNSKFLAQDPSGNFVVQHVLGLHNPFHSEQICVELKELYVQLSLQKGGSHVVEKCLSSYGMAHVVNVLLNHDKLYQVARDQYGNYVIQTALRATKRVNSPLHKSLLSKLLQNRNDLLYGFGKNVLSLIDNGIPLN